MQRDYCPKAKAEVKKTQIKSGKRQFDHKILIVLVFVLLIVFLSFLAIRTELTKFYRLKDNERVLLLDRQKPVAYLSFNIEHKQLTVTDLREVDFNLAKQDLSFANEAQQTLFYAFLLDTVFDHSYEYHELDLSKESLLTFFKSKKAYYFFLRDPDLLWREQKFNPHNLVTMEPVFDCPVAIINTTPEAGLANAVATILEKGAFLVIKKDSNTDNLAQSQIFYDPDQSSCGRLLAKLTTVLPSNIVTVDQEITLKYRASLVLYLGQDLADLYKLWLEKSASN